MIPQDTAAVVVYFSAAWPNYEVTEQTVHVWHESVLDIDPTVANEAMRVLVKSCEWFPSIARFRQECATIAERRRLKMATAAGLASGKSAPPPPELLAEIRMFVESAPVRLAKHNHKGPKPCPVCGGLPPKGNQAVGEA